MKTEMRETIFCRDPGTARVEEKTGAYREVRYLGRTKEQVLADAGRHHMTGSRGYEEFG